VCVLSGGPYLQTFTNVTSSAAMNI